MLDRRQLALPCSLCRWPAARRAGPGKSQKPDRVENPLLGALLGFVGRFVGFNALENSENSDLLTEETKESAGVEAETK